MERGSEEVRRVEGGWREGVREGRGEEVMEGEGG